MAVVAEKLIRKQFLIYPSQVEKMEKLAKDENASVAEMVRKAIAAFNPNHDMSNMEESELLSLVSTRVKEAIVDTRNTRKRLDETLEKLSVRAV